MSDISPILEWAESRGYDVQHTWGAWKLFRDEFGHNWKDFTIKHGSRRFVSVNKNGDVTEVSDYYKEDPSPPKNNVYLTYTHNESWYIVAKNAKQARNIGKRVRQEKIDVRARIVRDDSIVRDLIDRQQVVFERGNHEQE